MSKTYGLLSYILAIVLMCLVVNAFGAGRDAMESLSVVVKPDGKPSVSSIQVVVELVNNTDTTVKINTSGKNPPFTVIAVDDKGKSLRRYQSFHTCVVKPRLYCKNRILWM